MATLVRRGRVWSIVYKAKGEDGRWRTVFRTTGCTEEAEARGVLETFEAARAGRLKREAIRTILEEAGYQVGPEIGLDGLWEYYAEHAECTGSRRQQQTRRSMLLAFVRWMQSRHPELPQVRDVDERIAAEYWRWMGEDGKSASTRNNIRGQLVVTWRGIQAEAGLALNPWTLLPRDQGESESYRVLELEEILRIFRAAKDFGETGVERGFWPWAIVAGLHTGLRLGDLATLEWEELQATAGLLVLTPSKTKRWGPDRWAVHTLDAPWVGMLPARPEGGSGFVWPGAADRGRPEATRKLLGFGTICALAGIETKGTPKDRGRRKRPVKLVTFHSLRHSFVTHLLRGGQVTERDLVAQGNWSTEAVVRGVYNSAKWEQARLAAAKVAAAMPEVRWE